MNAQPSLKVLDACVSLIHMLRVVHRRSWLLIGALLLVGGCGSGSQPVPLAIATQTVMPPSATSTATPVPTDTPTPRGQRVVDASEPVGIVRATPGAPIVGGAPRMPAQYRVTHPDEVRVETVATGLQVPWALAFAPDGRLLISERPGRVRVLQGEN